MSKEFYLYRRDKRDKEGGGYSFIIEPCFDIRQVKLICLKRTPDNKRSDMAEFFFGYQEYRSLISTIEHLLKAGKQVNDTFFGGTDGKRRFGVVSKENKLTFFFADKIIQAKKGCENYTGELRFTIGDAKDFTRNSFDYHELFDTCITVNHWELASIKNLVKKTDKTRGVEEE
jgi:hypothetical protein